MKNEYSVVGDVVEILLKRTDGSSYITKISLSDFARINKIDCTWGILNSGSSFYVGMRKNKKQYLLHRVITNAPKGYVVDHINHDTLDNRKDNLRVVLQKENMQNLLSHRKNSSSGARGVCWDSNRERWLAHITLNYKFKFLGYFDSKDEATAAVEKARATQMPFSKEGMTCEDAA